MYQDSILDVIKTAENLQCETTYLQLRATSGLTPIVDTSIRRVLTRIGCEGYDDDYGDEPSSGGGFFSWVGNKIKKLLRKVNIGIRKLWAKLTGADEATKEFLDRAAHDDSIELKMSIPQGAAIIACGYAIIKVINVCVNSYLQGKKDEKDLETGKSEVIKCIKEAEDTKTTPKAKEAAIGEAEDKLHDMQKKKTRLDKNKTIKFCNAFRTVLAKIGKAIRNMFSRVKETSGKAESASKDVKDKEQKSTFMMGLRNMAIGVKEIFKAMWNFVKLTPPQLK